MDAGEPDLDPYGHVGNGESKQVPYPLSVGEGLARSRDISAMHGDTRVHQAHCGLLQPGQARRGPRLVGEGLGRAPIAACHRQHRPLAQRTHRVSGVGETEARIVRDLAWRE